MNNHLFFPRANFTAPPPRLSPPTSSLKMGTKSDALEAATFAEPLIRELGMSVDRGRLVELANQYSEDPDLVWFLLRVEGEIVGIVLAGVRAFWAHEKEAYVDGWVVRPGDRGKGHGGVLLKAVESWARRRGAKRVYRSSFSGRAADGWSAIQTTLMKEVP